MATITETLLTGTGSRELTVTTLTASDTFTFRPGANQVLTIMANVTSGSITVTLDGASTTTVNVPGAGAIDLSEGYTTGTIADGEIFAIPLDSIALYLSGVIAVTGGDDATVTLTGY